MLSTSAILAAMHGAPRGKWGSAGLFAVALATLAGRAGAQTSAPSAGTGVSLPVMSATLANGLRLVVSEDHARPLVAMETCYGVGDYDDPPGKTGLSELIANLLETPSTRHLPGDSRAALTLMLGVDALSYELSSNSRATCTTVLTQRGALPLALWLESDRMGFAADGVTTAAIESARANAADARSPGPIGAAYEAIKRAIFGEGLPRQGDTSGLGALTTTEIRDRLASHYGASRAMLVIAGDVDPRAAKAEVERAFGQLPKAAAESPAPATAPKPIAAGRITVRASKTRPSVIVAYGPTSNLFEEDDVRLDAIAGILGSRLQQRLGKTELTTGMSARQWSGRSTSYFTVHVDLAEGAADGAVLSAITEEIDRLGREGPSAEEVEAQRVRWSLQNIERLDDLKSRAGQLAEALSSGRPPEVAFAKVASYQRLDAASIQAVAKKQLAKSRRVVAVIEQDATASESGDVTVGGAP